MKKIRHLLFQSEFRIFIFILSLCLFLWPMVAVSNLSNVKLVFYWLYGSWLLMIFLLFLSDMITDKKREEEE